MEVELILVLRKIQSEEMNVFRNGNVQTTRNADGLNVREAMK